MPCICPMSPITSACPFLPNSTTCPFMARIRMSASLIFCWSLRTTGQVASMRLSPFWVTVW